MDLTPKAVYPQNICMGEGVNFKDLWDGDYGIGNKGFQDKNSGQVSWGIMLY